MNTFFQSAPVLLVAGFVLLVWGADVLVRGASRLAALFGISPLVIGLTVVAFGTSAPEMAVSTVSALSGQADIAMGNVIGSNIFNVLAILGLSAVVAPLSVSMQLIRLDVPLMIGVSVLFCLFGLNGVVTRPEALLLFAGVVAYTWFLVRQSRREEAAVQAEFSEAYGNRAARSWKAVSKDLLLVAAGLFLLVFGSKWLVSGAVQIARTLGVSELVIGLTIVAAGTSLPELATSVVATVRGERDIAVGNVIGSCLFNLMAVMGLAGTVAPAGIPVSAQSLRLDLPVMLLAAVACYPVFVTGKRISRGEGALFLCGYAAYTVCLVIIARG